MVKEQFSLNVEPVQFLVHLENNYEMNVLGCLEHTDSETLNKHFI